MHGEAALQVYQAIRPTPLLPTSGGLQNCCLPEFRLKLCSFRFFQDSIVQDSKALLSELSFSHSSSLLQVLHGYDPGVQLSSV